MRRIVVLVTWAWLCFMLGSRASAAGTLTCRTFIDNRHTHLILFARQREPLDLYAYHVDAADMIDNSATTTQFEWKVDSNGASIEGDTAENGHAVFRGGLQQKDYTVTVTATDPDGQRCTPASIVVSVDTDYEAYVSLGESSGVVYNEFSPGETTRRKFNDIRFAREFSQFSLPFFVGVDFNRMDSEHPANGSFGVCPSGDPGCVTMIGSVDAGGVSRFSQQYVPARTLIESSTQVRFGVKAFDPRIYLSVAMLNRSLDFAGYGHLRGAGFGLDKLPDLDRQFSLLGSLTYYPHAEGQYQSLAEQSVEVQYRLLTYRLGVAQTFFAGKFFADLGYEGDRASVRQNAPANFDHASTFVELGIHL